MISAWVLRMALLRLVEDPPLGLADTELAMLLLPDEGDRLQRGAALRDALTAAIESLKPAIPLPDDDPRWWPYRIYRGEYIEGRARADVQRDIAIASAAYTRAKRRGLNWVGAYLPYLVQQHERTVGA